MPIHPVSALQSFLNASRTPLELAQSEIKVRLDKESPTTVRRGHTVCFTNSEMHSLSIPDFLVFQKDRGAPQVLCSVEGVRTAAEGD